MASKINISPEKQKLIVYIFLTVVTLAVYCQVSRYDFVNFDDPVFVTQNVHIKSGISPEAIRWAFSTTSSSFWQPLIWLSFNMDYQLYGFNAGGYHLTNVVLHILSTLMLFMFLNRATGTLWRSAFVAALFALHPLHVESVARIAERKDTLSGFFFMLTLCLYVYYTQKPGVKRYLFVFLSFACGLMSKPTLVTLPVMMILLDYWPLNRFGARKDNPFSWPLKEKIPLFILAAVSSALTLYSQSAPHVMAWPPLGSRIINALASFVIYLEKTFWPYDLAVCYPLFGRLPGWQVMGAAFLILFVSVYVIMKIKNLPYLFVGWFWYSISLMPVIGIIPGGSVVMADHYTYLPLIGIFVMMAWGIPSFIRNENIRKNILFPAAIAVICVLSLLAWHQCGYWKNSITLFDHVLRVTKDNYLAHAHFASALAEEGRISEAVYNYSEAIRIKPDYAFPYNNRGNIYAMQGQYQRALEDYSEAIRVMPSYDDAYFNRGNVHAGLGKYQQAAEDFSEAIRLKPDAAAHYSRAIAYFMQGRNKPGCADALRACELGKCQALETARIKGYCR